MFSCFDSILGARKTKTEPEDGAKGEPKDDEAGLDGDIVKDEEMLPPDDEDDENAAASEEQLLQDACHKFESTLRQPARNLAVRPIVVAFEPATVYGKRAQFLPALVITAACLQRSCLRASAEVSRFFPLVALSGQREGQHLLEDTPLEEAYGDRSGDVGAL